MSRVSTTFFFSIYLFGYHYEYTHKKEKKEMCVWDGKQTKKIVSFSVHTHISFFFLGNDTVILHFRFVSPQNTSNPKREVKVYAHMHRSLHCMIRRPQQEQEQEHDKRRIE
mmetsp:Transcript_29531/g.41849  ORF Transcript_29531/g.41849 Transcript_29531/m.41849 type:complete len:111 (-) Transcript_29531:376-708(-)